MGWLADTLTHPEGLASSIADVLLGRSCAGCDTPGIVLCADCRRQLAPRPRLRRSLDMSDIATGLQLPVACSLDYRGDVRRILYRFKDHRIPQLAPVLGPALAAGIDFVATSTGIPARDVTLAVLPTRRSTARRRGFDPLGAVTRCAVARRPVGAIARPLVDTRRDGAAKTLGVWERQYAAAGAFEVAGALPIGPVILVDDIVTTGATAREAAATLILAGVHVIALATIAGTP